MNSLSVKSVVFIYASKKRLLFLGWVIGAIGLSKKRKLAYTATGACLKCNSVDTPFLCHP